MFPETITHEVYVQTSSNYNQNDRNDTGYNNQI